MKSSSLSRQILQSMTAMALGVTLLVVFTSYVFYYVAMMYWPEHFGAPSLLPNGPEWIWLITTTLTALALASVVAVNLSRRILLPLNSVAESIRRVADGDLSARAEAGDPSLGEAARLADDFNALAGQLQRVTEEQTFWNAAIAHELRTPVTILRGRLQGLAEGVFTPSENQFRSLLAQVEGLTRLIEDLRIVSLADSGHLDLQWQDSTLEAEVTAVAHLFEDALEAVGQRAVLALDSRTVYCDPVRIRQALLALLENARKHASPGCIRIGSQVTDYWYHLYVEDEGPGIPSEVAGDIFKAFHRLHEHLAGGSGLGLAVVAAIARAHSGHASCMPLENGGTRFELCWPLRNAPPDT